MTAVPFPNRTTMIAGVPVAPALSPPVTRRHFPRKRNCLNQALSSYLFKNKPSSATGLFVLLYCHSSISQPNFLTEPARRVTPNAGHQAYTTIFCQSVVPGWAPVFLYVIFLFVPKFFSFFNLVINGVKDKPVRLLLMRYDFRLLPSQQPQQCSFLGSDPFVWWPAAVDRNHPLITPFPM